MDDSTGATRKPNADPVIEAYKKDVDRTLIRENLKRSHEERLLNLMRLQRFAEELRRAGRKARPNSKSVDVPEIQRSPTQFPNQEVRMTYWEYRRLVTFWRTSEHNLLEERTIGREEDGRWYFDHPPAIPFALADRLYAGGRTPTRLPLNPGRDWKALVRRTSTTWGLPDSLAWDEEAEYADLAMEVLARLGAMGWELVCRDNGTYLLKRPRDVEANT